MAFRGAASAIAIQTSGNYGEPPNAPQRGMFASTELCATAASGTAPWTGAGIASGTAAVLSAAGKEHPGGLSIASSTTTMSGYVFYAFQGGILLAGGESTDIIFRIATSGSALSSFRFGFSDSVTVSDPTDGAWLNINTLTLDGRCKNNAGPTTTISTYTLSENVWYRGRVAVGQNANRVDFYLYDCTTGAVLWTDNVQANIPNGAGRETGHSVIAFNSGTSVLPMLQVDYINLAIDRVFAR